MNKKILLGIIIGLTIIASSIIIISKIKPTYNKLVINDITTITVDRNYSDNIKIEQLVFNDYGLMITNDNTIYYSVVDTSNKYNPYISYTTNDKTLKIAFSNELNDDLINNESTIKVIIYNDKYYRMYDLVITDLPIISINNRDNYSVSIDIFDNHINIPNRIIRSDGKLMTLNDNEYLFSLMKESLGHNQRKNEISILGNDKQNKYLLTKVEEKDLTKKNVYLFINHEYKGIFVLEERKMMKNNGQKENNNNN